MSVKHIDIDVHGGLTTDVTLALAKSYNMTEGRRVTFTVHQVPAAAAILTGEVRIFAAPVDETAWYTELSTLNLNTAVEKADDIDISTVNPGRALRFLRVVITNLSNGIVDIKLAASRS